jgi:hypothetical protein
MIIHRGLFRLWLLVGVIWITFWAWRRDLVCEFNLPAYGNGPWCEYQYWDWHYHAATAGVLLGPPLLLGFIGWTICGFLADRRP